VVLAHLIFSRICIGFQLINALNSNSPRWHTTPLSLLIYILCLTITLPHVLCVLLPPIFHVSAQPLPPAVLALQPPQFGTHYPLASVVLPLQTLFVASLKLTVSSRPTTSPSGSVKCLRFGHWPTLCTLNMLVLTYYIVRTTFKVYGKKQNVYLQPTKTPKPIVTKFKRRNYVVNTYHQKLGSIRPGVFAPHIEKIYTPTVRNLLHFFNA